MMLYCLVAMYAAHHSRLSAAERGVKVLLLTLRTKVLRHEFLQCLLNKGALQPEQVIFGGRLPDRLQQAGVLDDDQEHFRKLVLGKAEVQSQLHTYMSYRVRLKTEHAKPMREHADGSWITTEEVATLKHLAREALQQLWMFFEVYQTAEAEAFGKVALVIVTTDVALNIYGKAASHGSPAMRLMKQKKAIALILDEIQRCPIETYVALASHNKTVVAVGDRGQEIYPFSSSEQTGLQVQTFANPTRPTFVAEMFVGTDRGCAWRT